MKRTLEYTSAFILIAIIMIACLIMTSSIKDDKNKSKQNIDELISLARKNGMTRYKLAVITLYENVNTDKIDSVYNESLKKDSVQ